MNRLETRSGLRLLSLIPFLLLCLVWAAPSKGNDYVNEDPSVLGPGQEWYLIVLDAKGTSTRSEGWGYGGGWYYYPLTNTYRQWFYRGPYNASQGACMTISSAIISVDPNRMSAVTINYIWSTPAWSARGSGRPPLPDDASTQVKESQYVASQNFFSFVPSFIGSVEPTQDYTISAYSPEWVGIELQGRNVEVLRWVAPVCASTASVVGACCNSATGECSLTTQGNCPYPLAWKGAGTTCSSCSSQTGTIDFGDAPDSYCTLLKSDGARHTIVAGVYLGRLIDAEPDGQPNATATGDDINGVDDEDGVVFTSPLSPGDPTTLDVVASVQGYLNAWIDFGHDGTFSSAGDQIFKDTLLSPGTNHLTFNVPATASLGDTFARFRFNRRGLLSWKGPADDGEVEDYKISIVGAFEPQPSSAKGAAKWSQTPQAAASTPFVFQAWGEPSDLYLGQALADDWQCKDSRPVTGFQWWGTFAGWQESRLPAQLPSAFQIGIWTHNPGTGSPTLFAHPDTLVWQTTCSHWAWSVAGRANDPRKINNNETCFEFTCLLSQNEWFYQDPGSGTRTYWLSIAAVYDPNSAVANPWAWMTGPYSSGNGATRITALTPPLGAAPWPPSVASVWSAGTQIKDKQGALQNLAFDVLTNQGQTASDLNLAPVYRFWSNSMKTHFYTISETEKKKLIDLFADVWLYEGIAFYAYPPGSQPVSAMPVYRFRSTADGDHFYTISDIEKNKLMKAVPSEWVYEGIVWYTYDNAS
jgi:hypothetical protein